MRTVKYGLSGPLPGDDQPMPYFDGFWLRLVKLFPWELLAFFALFCLLVPAVEIRLLVLVAMIVALPWIYFLINLLIFSVPIEQQPLPQYYILAGISMLLAGCAVAGGAEYFQLTADAFLVGAVVWALLAAPVIDLLIEQVSQPYYPHA